MKVIHTISSTSPNPTGLCDLTPNERSYLAYPSTSQAGTLQIFDCEALVSGHGVIVCCTCGADSLLGHMAQMLGLGFDYCDGL